MPFNLAFCCLTGLYPGYGFCFKISKTSVSWPVSATTVQTSIQALGSDIRLHSRQQTTWLVCPINHGNHCLKLKSPPPKSSCPFHFLPHPLHGTEPYVLLALPLLCLLDPFPSPTPSVLLWDFIPSCLGHYSSLKLPLPEFVSPFNSVSKRSPPCNVLSKM